MRTMSDFKNDVRATLRRKLDARLGVSGGPVSAVVELAPVFAGSRRAAPRKDAASNYAAVCCGKRDRPDEPVLVDLELDLDEWDSSFLCVDRLHVNAPVVPTQPTLHAEPVHDEDVVLEPVRSPTDSLYTAFCAMDMASLEEESPFSLEERLVMTDAEHKNEMYFRNFLDRLLSDRQHALDVAWWSNESVEWTPEVAPSTPGSFASVELDPEGSFFAELDATVLSVDGFFV